MDAILQEACLSLQETDGLLILAHGLGLLRLLLRSISPYLTIKEDSSSSPALIFIVNADNSCIQLLREGLFAEGFLPSMIPKVRTLIIISYSFFPKLKSISSSCGVDYHQ